MFFRFIHTEKLYIRKCLSDIEQEMHWGPSTEWTNFHFQKLSQLITEKTGDTLSVSSVRRLFTSGIDFIPQPETRATLARFMGCVTWLGYKEKQRETIYKYWLRNVIKQYVHLRIGLVLFIVGGLFAAYFAGNYFLRPVKVVATLFPSQGNPPLTVITQYSVSNKGNNDIFIDFGEFFHNPHRLMLPDRGHVLTHTYMQSYYYPVKIMMEKKILWQDKVHVLSDGWEYGVFTRTPPKYYSIHRDSGHQTCLYLAPRLLAFYGIDTTRSYYTEFKNIRRFGVLCDDLTLSFRMKISRTTFSRGCHDATVLLLGKYNNLKATFTTPGCSGLSSISFSDFKRSGRFNELNGFSQNFFQFVQIMIKTSRMKTKISINGNEIYNFSYNKTAGELYGIHFYCLGPVTLDHIMLADSNRTVVLNDFVNDVDSTVILQ